MHDVIIIIIIIIITIRRVTAKALCAFPVAYGSRLLVLVYALLKPVLEGLLLCRESFLQVLSPGPCLGVVNYVLLPCVGEDSHVLFVHTSQVLRSPCLYECRRLVSRG